MASCGLTEVFASCVPWLRRDLFSVAVEEGRVADVKAMLARSSGPEMRLLQPSLKYRYSPWHVAAHKGHLEVLHALVDAILTGSQSSLLFTASLHRKFFAAGRAPGHGVTVEELLRGCLSHGIRGGFTPLMLAARAGHKEVLCYLLDIGADPWQGDGSGMTAIHHAARHNKFQIVQELVLQATPPTANAGRLVKPTTKFINCPDLSGWTALHYAVQAKHDATVAILVSYNANLIARTLKQHPVYAQLPPGATALHIAGFQGNLPMIVQLLRAHFEGLASLLPGHLETQERRRRQRAHPDPRLVISRTGQLPYHLARPLHRGEICEWLDPSVPLMFLLSATDEGAAGGAAGGPTSSSQTGSASDLATVGVPRLTLLAAKALHAGLLLDLKRVEGEQEERRKEQARERQRRVEAAEAAARERGVWLAKRAALKAVQAEEEEEANGSVRSGAGGGTGAGGPLGPRSAAGAAGAARRASRRTSAHGRGRRGSVHASTPHRLMHAVRSSISRFAGPGPSPPSDDEQTNVPHLGALGLQLPDDPHTNPFARIGADGVDSPPGPQLHYTVAHFTHGSRTARGTPTQQQLPLPAMPRSSSSAGEGGLSNMHSAPPGLDMGGEQSGVSAGASLVTPVASGSLLLTAAHDELGSLVAYAATAPSERDTPRETGTSGTDGLGSIAGTSPRSSEEAPTSVALRPAAALAPTDEPLLSPLSPVRTAFGAAASHAAATLHSPVSTSPSQDLSQPVTSVTRPVSVPHPQQQPYDQQARHSLQLPGAVSSAPGTPGPPSTPPEAASPSSRPTPGTSNRPSGVPRLSTHLSTRSRLASTSLARGLTDLVRDAEPRDGPPPGPQRSARGAEAAAAGTAGASPRVTASDGAAAASYTPQRRTPPRAVPDPHDLGPEPELEEPETARSTGTARSLFQSLTQPFRRPAQVAPLPLGQQADPSARARLSTAARGSDLPASDTSVRSATTAWRDSLDDGVDRTSTITHHHTRTEEASDGGSQQVAKPGAEVTKGGEDEEEEEEEACAVCLDAWPDVQMSRCNHRLCLTCCKDLCQRHCLTPALCPLCRSIISGFTLAPAAPLAGEGGWTKA